MIKASVYVTIKQSVLDPQGLPFKVHCIPWDLQRLKVSASVNIWSCSSIQMIATRRKPASKKCAKSCWPTRSLKITALNWRANP